MARRVCILGTAPSWKSAPFDDPGLEFWCLNDMWTLRPPRVDAWFELHPLDKLHYRPVTQRLVYAEEVPHGYYVRPQGHIDQLRQMSKSIPVYLQNDPPKDFGPHARRFPIEAVVAEFGDYFASGPAFEVALAIMEGVEEIQVWGIELATDHERQQQRFQFEHILGIARGRGIRVVMAPQSPVMKHGWRYAYEPKPAEHPAKAVLRKTQHEKAELTKALAALPWYRPRGPLTDRLQRAAAVEVDCYRALQQRAPIVLQVGG